jgi:hypothetical protein
LLRIKFEVDVAIDQAQQMIFRNLIFEPKVIKQRLRAGMVPHHKQQPPNAIVNSSIENSGLLITRTLHRHKHQLRDFSNRHS